MVCIAAFVILLLLVLTVPIIRLFNKNLAHKIITLFKKSLHCASRRATLRSCDSSFKEDVKNGVLRKVVIKHPRWVKPLSISIEIISVLIVFLTIWSLLVGAKSLVSLYVYGTCDISNPSSCSLDTSKSCSIDAVTVDFWQHPVGWTANWFSEFGEAIKGIPDRAKTWRVEDYLPKVTDYYGTYKHGKPLALDIFDPGCIVCLRSYKKQLESGFFEKYNVAMLPYPIVDTKIKNGYKFPNSYLVTQYIMATNIKPLGGGRNPAGWQILDYLYTKKDDRGIPYQTAFNASYDKDKAEKVIIDWLSKMGYSNSDLKYLTEIARSKQVSDLIKFNYELVDKRIKTKKIPTVIFDGRRYDGEFQIKDFKK